MRWPIPFRRPPPLASGAALAEFLARECAYLAQKTATDYCQAKAGLNWQKLATEPEFQAALNVCRWEAFAGVLADAVLVLEGRLRPAAPDLAVLAESLVGLHAGILESHPVPPHLPQGWGAETAALAPRLARAQLAKPQPVETLARSGARRLFDALPIHPDLRRHDYEMVENAVRFGLVAFSVKLDSRLDAAAAARALRSEASHNL